MLNLAHVFYDYNWAILLIFAVSQLTLSLLHLIVNWQVFTINIFYFIVKILFKILIFTWSGY